MIVAISSAAGTLLWERSSYSDAPAGLSNPSYIYDGTQSKIIAALREALEQAEAQLSGGLKEGDIIPYVRPSASEMDNNIPVVTVRDRNARRQHTVEATVITMPFSSAKGTKVAVVHD